MARQITADSIVHIAAAGWENSDASMHVIAVTSKKAHKAIGWLMEQTAEHSDEEGALDQLWYVGPFAEPLEKIVSDRELPEAIRELEEFGVYYPESA